jgi:phosphatidylethanolamine-binding protein (PEBP) family uncharacterized protein
MRVGFFNHGPHFERLGFCHWVVYDIASDQYDSLVEQQLCEEGKYDVRRGVGAIALEVLQVGAHLKLCKRYEAVILPLSQHFEMAISAMDRKEEHGCLAGPESW